MKRLRVLISSHEFSPYQGSECAIGWNICTRMAAFHDVTVLCASGSPHSPNAYKTAFSRYSNDNEAISHLKIVFVDQPPRALEYAHLNRNMFDISDGVGSRFLFYKGLDVWHQEAYRTALKLGVNNFDVVHQLTPISFLSPGYMWKLKLPFFWGPIGGMYKVPFAFARWSGAKSWIFEIIRSINIEWQIRMSRSFRLAARKATVVWTITADERRVIDKVVGNKSIPMIDTASNRTGRVRKFDGYRPLRLCWSGSHEARKALPFLFYAISQLADPNKIVLDILGGGGSETHHWQKLSKSLGLEGVTWYPRLPYAVFLENINKADVFVHTSIREAASAVVPEALGMGLPVICHDTCGMSIAVDDSCGMKVPFVDPKTSIEGFRNALDRILKFPDMVEKLSAGALKRAEILSWDAKVKEIADCYLQFA